MGFKMPIVCKEVYIPFDETTDDGITLDQYKEKYGIDLNDYFVFDADADSIGKQPVNAKIYMVELYKGEIVKVNPCRLFTGADSATIVMLDYEYAIGEDDELLVVAYIGFGWDHSTQTLQSKEM